ncbi:hypothetical protein AB7W75_00950 [Providencia huaxiensis]
MGNTCLFTRIRSRLSLHHEISMVRLVTGFLLADLWHQVTATIDI